MDFERGDCDYLALGVSGILEYFERAIAKMDRSMLDSP